MPHLTRRQKQQLADIEHYLHKIHMRLTDDRTVVTMRSGGAATTEFHNARTDAWLHPVKPLELLAWVDNALRSIDSMVGDATPKGAGQ